MDVSHLVQSTKVFITCRETHHSSDTTLQSDGNGNVPQCEEKMLF